MPAKPRRAWRSASGALLATAFLAAAGHSAGWFWLCDRLEEGFATWAAIRRAEGWRVEHGPPRRGGWPFSASLVLPGFRLEGGAGLLPGGVDWRTEGLALRVSPPRLDRLALEAPGRHRLRLGGTELPPFTADRLDAALPLRSNGNGPPSEANAVARSLRFGAVEVASASVDFDARPEGRDSANTLRASAAGVALPPGLPGTDRLGRVVDRIGLDLVLTGAVPPGGDPARRAAAWRDGGGGLEIRALDARWGEVAASAAAALTLDGALQPAGAGTLRLTGGEALLEAAGGAGLLPPFTAAAAAFALRALSRPPQEGGPARAEVPLALRDRTLRLGPVVLGRLPALEWDAARPGSRAVQP
ncbi:MAG: DUF2125 domain-containing protein [Acetobacteraceae bacterium]|nr:DUF2125 domain-containing protein [Acetobacteraceae bacterium]